MSVAVWIAVPFFQSKEDRDLPFKIWLPYDFKVEKIFWITYVPESIALIASALIAIVCDITISAFMITICGQFDILSYRLQNLPNLIEAMKESKLPESDIEALQKKLIVGHIRHHVSLFELVLYKRNLLFGLLTYFKCFLDVQKQFVILLDARY